MAVKKTLLFLFVLAGFGSTAQNITDLPANSAPFNMNGQVVKAFDNRYEGIRGTYLLLDNFSAGVVDLKKGQIKDASLNYDAYTHKVLTKKGDVVYELRKDLIISFTLTVHPDTIYRFIPKDLDQGQTFLLVIQEELALYCHVTKILKKAEIGGAYKINSINYDQFVSQNSYYIEKDGALHPIKANKKGFITALPDYKEKIELYLKQTKVDFKNHEEVIPMMHWVVLN